MEQCSADCAVCVALQPGLMDPFLALRLALSTISLPDREIGAIGLGILVRRISVKLDME